MESFQVFSSIARRDFKVSLGCEMRLKCYVVLSVDRSSKTSKKKAWKTSTLDAMWHRMNHHNESPQVSFTWTCEHGFFTSKQYSDNGRRSKEKALEKASRMNFMRDEKIRMKIAKRGGIATTWGRIWKWNRRQCRWGVQKTRRRITRTHTSIGLGGIES